MKITISKNSFVTAQEEIADISSTISGESVSVYPLKHTIKYLNDQELRYFYWEETDREVTLIIEDEVIFETLRFYRRLAKPINSIVNTFINLGSVLADEALEFGKVLARKR
jgi:hypothetical protein